VRSTPRGRAEITTPQEFLQNTAARRAAHHGIVSIIIRGRLETSATRRSLNGLIASVRALRASDRARGGPMQRSTAMPLRIILLAIFAAVLLGDIQTASAQSAYSYPWCGIRGRSGSMSCYYTSWEQCRATLWGIGGNCIQSPYYKPAPSTAPRRRAEQRR
jgi:hypothetical protein